MPESLKAVWAKYFREKQPPMPDEYKPLWNTAFLYLRKYRALQVQGVDMYEEALQAAEDTAEAFLNDPFVIDIMLDLFGELERLRFKEDE